MPGFVGRFDHSLDAKGRLILPAHFRPAFERGGYLTLNFERCLSLWTPGEFDRQGRMGIPAHLREFAGLAGAVLVTGAIDHIELWNPEEWQQRVAPAQAVFLGETV